MKTVLAPIDFSSAGDRVIAEAVALARAIGARLVLLHVVTPREAGEAAARRLARIQRGLRDAGITAHAIHTGGDARQDIVAQAERLAASYIVMGSHGRTALYEVLVGGTASGVLRDAACTVVLVPPATRPGWGAKTPAPKPAGP